jgi:hypothetical protein
MNSKAFEMLLDRLGTDFDAWPSDEAREAKALLATSDEARKAYDMLLRIEGLIGASRPRVAAGTEQIVIRRALADIALREASPTLLDRFRALIFAPVPRAAFALSLAALGFAVGIVVGSPLTDRAADTGGSMITASGDDVVF